MKAKDKVALTQTARAIASMRDDAQEILDEEQARFDKRSERSQESDAGQAQADLISSLEQAVTYMQDVVDNLNDVTGGDA